MNIVEKIHNFNNKIAIKITNSVGSMTCAYLFCCLSLYGLSRVDMHNPFQIVSWISQTFLQLVLLSIIMLGQNLKAEASEHRAIEDHNTILKEFKEIKQIHVELQEALSQKFPKF